MSRAVWYQFDWSGYRANYSPFYLALCSSDVYQMWTFMLSLLFVSLFHWASWCIRCTQSHIKCPSSVPLHIVWPRSNVTQSPTWPKQASAINRSLHVTLFRRSTGIKSEQPWPSRSYIKLVVREGGRRKKAQPAMAEERSAYYYYCR